jgi:hypothetical protein
MRIQAPDLQRVQVALPPALAANAIPLAEAPIGQTAQRAISPGELLERTSISEARTGPDRLVSISVDPAWSLADALEVGATVDVFATQGEGTDATTRLVARDVVVNSIRDRNSSAIGDAGGRQITLQVRQPRQLIALIHAARSAAITIASTRPGHLTPMVPPVPTAGRATLPTSGQ